MMPDVKGELNLHWNTKSRFQQDEESFHQHIGLKFKEESSKVLHLEYSFVLCWNLDTSESRSEIAGKFWIELLENDGADQLERLCEEWSVTKSLGGDEYSTYSKKKEG